MITDSAVIMVFNKGVVYLCSNDSPGIAGITPIGLVPDVPPTFDEMLSTHEPDMNYL